MGWLSEGLGQHIHTTHTHPTHTHTQAASNFTAFFEHLLAPDVAIAQFNPDLSDVVRKCVGV